MGNPLRRVALGFLLLATVPTPSAHAQNLRERDLEPGSGDHLITRDLAQGLDWLDLTAGAFCWSGVATTYNYYYCKRDVSPWLSNGWRYATTDEVCGLLGRTLFGDPAQCGGNTDRGPAAYLVGLLGVTYQLSAAGSGTRSQAVFDDGTRNSLYGFASVRVDSGPVPDGASVLQDFTPDATNKGHTQLLVRPSPECEDGIDNDGDEFIDYPNDPGCRDSASLLEDAQCQDGLDNDGETGIDFDGGAAAGNPTGIPDPECTTPWRNHEFFASSGDGTCGLGFELAVLLPALQWVYGRRRRTHYPGFDRRVVHSDASGNREEGGVPA